MLQAHGPVPADYYQLLQLQSSAPRELVVQTYWMLVERAQQRPHVSDAAELDALRQAFEMLSCDELRRPPVRRSLRAPTGPDDYYSTLHVNPDADADVIALAHSVLSRVRRSAAERALLDAAYQTLSNSYRRARYDESLAVSRAPELRASVSQRSPVRPFELRIRHVEQLQPPIANQG